MAALEGSVVTTANESDGDPTINLPGSVAVDEAVVVVVNSDGDTVWTWPGTGDDAWTQIAITTGAGNNNVSCEIRARIATAGNQGDTTVAITGDNESHVSFAFRVSDLENGINSVEAAMGAVATTANPDPPSLDPSWSANSTLWFTGMAKKRANQTWDASPEPTTPSPGWTLQDVYPDSVGSSSGTSGGIAVDNGIDAASVDPGTWAPGFGSRQTIAWTLAFEDATGGPPAAVPRRGLLLVGVGR